MNQKDETARNLVPPTAQDSAREWAATRLSALEDILDADGLTIISSLHDGVEHLVKMAIEARKDRRRSLFVVLDTHAGSHTAAALTCEHTA